MGAGPDPAVHHGEQYTVLAQSRDHVVAADPGAVGFEKHQIGFGLLHVDAGDLRQPPRQRPGVAVVLGEPVDMVVECVSAGGGANAGLAHRAAKALLPAPDLVDEIARAAMTAPIGAPSPFEKSIQAESHPIVMSLAPMPVATQAFNSRAPSMWVASPFDLAICTISSRSVLFQMVPPPILAVCSTLTTVCGG